jgi:hypothetical protein
MDHQNFFILISRNWIMDIFTSCSQVVRALVYQPSGPGFDSWHVSFRVSYYKGENPNDAAATYLIFVDIFTYYTSRAVGKYPELLF